MSTPLARLALPGLAALLLSAAACTAAAPYGFHRATAAPFPTRGILGEAEIADAHVADAYDAITHLRPTYLNFQRMSTGYERRLVYLDGLLIGDIEALHSVPAAHIHEIRLLTPLDGGYALPLNNSGGAILITTKVGRGR
jgi:hypothetical protein